MPGGDGRDSRGPSGGVNGNAGKGGPTGNGSDTRGPTGGVNGSSGNGGKSGNGGYDGHNIGGHTVDNGDGTSTTTDNRGSITHQNGNSGSGNNGRTPNGNGGGQGNSNNSGSNTNQGTKPSPTVNVTLFPEAQASTIAGAPLNISIIDGMWGFSLLKSTTIQKALADAFAKMKSLTASSIGTTAVLRGTMWGLVIEAITPTKIAPDDMSMVPNILTTIPAKYLTNASSTSLSESTSALVEARVVDVIDEGQQKIAIIRDRQAAMSVPVVEAKPTKRKDVYTASVVPGKPDIHINISNPEIPSASAPSVPNIKPENSNSAKQIPSFSHGNNTHDRIINFPPTSKVPPIYVSVIEPISKEKLADKTNEYDKRTREEVEFTRQAVENMKKIRARLPTDEDISSLSPLAQTAYWKNQAKKEFSLSVTDTDLSKNPPFAPSKPTSRYLDHSAYFWRENGFALERYNSVSEDDSLEGQIQDAFAKASIPLNEQPAAKLYPGNGTTLSAKFAQVQFFFSEKMESEGINALSSLDTDSLGFSSDELREALGTYRSVKVPFRLASKRTTVNESDKIEVDIIKPDGNNISDIVPLRPLTINQTTKELKFTSDDSAITITWTPANDKNLSGYIVTFETVGMKPGKINTGGKIEITSKGTLTPFPLNDAKDAHDYILVPPVESGLNPIYIMISKKNTKKSASTGPTLTKPRKQGKDYGLSYYPPPKTEDIKGLGELTEVRGRTPKVGGGGYRRRWTADKGKKIYEWDSQEAELEGYRSSDGAHIGSFDPATGRQLKGPKARNIKKYL